MKIRMRLKGKNNWKSLENLISKMKRRKMMKHKLELIKHWALKYLVRMKRSLKNLK